MKAAKTIIKILVILLTSVWGVFFGILAPLVFRSDDFYIDIHGIMLVCIIMAIIGYIVPCFLIMLNLSKSAAGFSITGTILMLFIHNSLGKIEQYGVNSVLYLPQIFMTILTIIYIFVLNPQYLEGHKQKHAEKRNAAAPSILDRKE